MSAPVKKKPSGWNQSKTTAFRAAFMDFLKYVKINSKETGSDTVLADAIYEAQQRFLDCIFDGLAEDIHDFKILKSRQLGVSTMSRALSMFWLGMNPGLQGAMVFDTQAHREEARNEIMTMIRNLPAHLNFPTVKKDSRDMLILSNDSTLRFLNAGTKKSKTAGTLGRSSGLNFVHASEMCSWDNDEGLVSFKNALSETYPDRLYIWESTARGFNKWYEMWQEAKADTLNQKTCFIGWWAKESQRIEKDTPAFEQYGKEDPNDTEFEKMQNVEKRYQHKVTSEQLAWYRRKANPIAGNDNEQSDNEEFVPDELTKQEQPWDEEEAFLLSGSTFFNGERLTEIMNTTVSKKFQPWDFLPGFSFMESTFMEGEIKKCNLKIWDEPDPDGVYVIAADPAYGHREDNNNSALQIMRCYADKIEQVGEFASSLIQPQPFTWAMVSLAGWYKNSTVIFEINGPGEVMLVEFKALKRDLNTGYLRSEGREKGVADVFNNMRQYMYSREDSVNGLGSAYQFKTTTQLKVAIMERLSGFVQNKTVIIKSEEAVKEMRSIVRDGDSIGAEGRARDDRTFTLALAIKAWEQGNRRMMSNQGRTFAFESSRKRLSLKDQIGMFNQNRLDSFFKQKEAQRRRETAIIRRKTWRER